jgi:hypothetical protein
MIELLRKTLLEDDSATIEVRCCYHLLVLEVAYRGLFNTLTEECFESLLYLIGTPEIA